MDPDQGYKQKSDIEPTLGAGNNLSQNINNQQKVFSFVSHKKHLFFVLPFIILLIISLIYFLLYVINYKNNSIFNQNSPTGYSDTSNSKVLFVTEADGNHVTFSVPVDSSIEASQVITVDASRCKINQEQINKLTPIWSGDSSISLPWANEIYRSWQDADFTGSGVPKGPYAVVTVHSDKALGKGSHTQLAGNTKGCSSSGCVNDTVLKNPTDTKYNATDSKSDFTFLAPCDPQVYYSMCQEENVLATDPVSKVITIKGDDNNQSLPKAIKYGGFDYVKVVGLDDSQKKSAKEIQTGWTESGGCPNKIGDDCMKHIISANSDVVDGNLLVDGVPEPSCDIKKNPGTFCHDAATYGDHVAWVRTVTESGLDKYGKVIGDTKFHSTVVYDRKDLYKGENISHLVLFKDHVIYLETKNVPNAYEHIFYDGKDMGPLDTSNYTVNDIFRGGQMDFVFGDHIAFQNSQGKLVVDGNEIGDNIDYFYGLGNHYRAVRSQDGKNGASYIVDGAKVSTELSNNTALNENIPIIFGKNVLFGKEIEDSEILSTIFNGKEVNFSETIEARRKYMEKVRAKCSEFSIFTYGKDDPYCDPYIWGKKTDKESMFYYQGGIPLLGPYGLWGNRFAFLTNLHKNSLFGPDMLNDKDSDRHEVIYDSGKIVDTPTNSFVKYIELFEDNLYYTITFGAYNSEPSSLYRNGLEISKSKEIKDVQFFKNHYAYINENDHLIYDGKDLGQIDTAPGNFKLYGDHIAYYFADGSKVIFDNKKYSYYDSNTSVMTSMAACRKGYIDDRSISF